MESTLPMNNQALLRLVLNTHGELSSSGSARKAGTTGLGHIALHRL